MRIINKYKKQIKIQLGRIIIFQRELRRKWRVKSFWKKLLTLLKWTGISILIIIILLFIYSIYLKSILPDVRSVGTIYDEMTIVIYDRNNEPIHRMYNDKDKEYIELDKLPNYVKWSFIAAEDSSFYDHKGYNLVAMTSCTIKSIFSILSDGEYGILCGGSTINQQLVRNTIMYDVFGEKAFERTNIFRTIKRKIDEIIIAYNLEKVYTKDEILQMYLNVVPLGGVNYGIESASLEYFDKHATELTLEESATLAGIVQAPTAYNPIFGSMPEMADKRKAYVLDQLLDLGKSIVTEEEVIQALEKEAVFTLTNSDAFAPHFIEYVMIELGDSIDNQLVLNGGLHITTSLDTNLQRIAEEEVSKGIQEIGSQFNAHNGALIAIKPEEFSILSMVGSVNYWDTSPHVDGNVNVTTSYRQMGSTIKPYTYISAIRKGYGMWLLTPDIKELGDIYSVDNYDFKHKGLISARQALVQSNNIGALYTLETIGLNSLTDVLSELDIKSDEENLENHGLVLTLGTANMKLIDNVAGYTAFASGGYRKPVKSILKIKDKHGKVLLDNTERESEKVFEDYEAYMINWTLCDLGGFNDQPYSQEPYSYYSTNNKRDLCGKTGTTDGPRDLLAIQYHKNLVVGTWVGNNDNLEMEDGWSHNVSLPITNSFLRRSAQYIEVESFKKPDDIIDVEICTETGNEAIFDKASLTNRIPITNCNKKEASITHKLLNLDTDHRRRYYICTATGLVADNWDSITNESIVHEMIYLNKEIENPLRQDLYDKYISSLGYITSIPGSAGCEYTREGYSYENGLQVIFGGYVDGSEVSRGSEMYFQLSLYFYDIDTNIKIELDTPSGTELVTLENIWPPEQGASAIHEYRYEDIIPLNAPLGKFTYKFRVYNSSNQIINQNSSSIIITD